MFDILVLVLLVQSTQRLLKIIQYTLQCFSLQLFVSWNTQTFFSHLIDPHSNNVITEQVGPGSPIAFTY